jgi:hypothetical protein
MGIEMAFEILTWLIILDIIGKKIITFDGLFSKILLI